MAHFSGNLKGSRGEATRCGTASSGLSVSARSWAGSVTVRMEDEDGEVIVYIRAAHTSAVGGQLVWCGKIEELLSSSLYTGTAIRADKVNG